MAHHHDFAWKLVILKTSEGFLTPTGFTQDVTSKDIIVIMARFLGGLWSPKENRIKEFKKHLEVDLTLDVSDCRFFAYNAENTDRLNFDENSSEWY